MHVCSTFLRSRLLFSGLLAAGIGATAVQAAASADTPSITATDGVACSSYRADYAYPIQLCGRGEAVRLAQVGLRTAGFDVAADGYFGPRTHAALITFQSNRGLPATGEIDEATWTSLTGGAVDGYDADASGIIDPWEAGGDPPAPLPPQGGGSGSGAWAVVLAVSTRWEDASLWTATETASALGYDGVGPTCRNGAAAAFGHPASATLTYYSVSVTFDSRHLADEARAALAERGVDSRVGYVEFTCGR